MLRAAGSRWPWKAGSAWLQVAGAVSVPAAELDTRTWRAPCSFLRVAAGAVGTGTRDALGPREPAAAFVIGGAPAVGPRLTSFCTPPVTDVAAVSVSAAELDAHAWRSPCSFFRVVVGAVGTETQDAPGPREPAATFVVGGAPAVIGPRFTRCTPPATDVASGSRGSVRGAVRRGSSADATSVMSMVVCRRLRLPAVEPGLSWVVTAWLSSVP